jgi:hypothetical protein
MIIIKTAIGIISISIALIILYAIGKVTRPLIDPSADAEEHIILTWLSGVLGVSIMVLVVLIILWCWTIGNAVMQHIQ